MIKSIQQKPNNNTVFKKQEYNEDKSQAYQSKSFLSKTEYTPYGNSYEASSACKALFPIATTIYKTVKFIANKDIYSESYKQISAMRGKNFSRGGFVASNILSIAYSGLMAFVFGSICDKLTNYKRGNNADINAINAEQYYNYYDNSEI